MQNMKRILALLVVFAMTLSVSVFADYEGQEDSGEIAAVEAAVKAAGDAVNTATAAANTVEAVDPEAPVATEITAEAVEEAAGDLDALSALVNGAAAAADKAADNAKAAAETTKTAAAALQQQVKDGAFEALSEEDAESVEIVVNEETGETVTAQDIADAAKAAAEAAAKASENASNAADAAEYAIEASGEEATEAEQQTIDAAKETAQVAAEKSEAAQAAAEKVEDVINLASADVTEAAAVVAEAAQAATEAADAALDAAAAAKDAADTIAVIRDAIDQEAEEVVAAKAVVNEKVQIAVDKANIATEKAAIAQAAAERAKDVALKGEEKAQAIAEAAKAAKEATKAANEAAEAANDAADAAWELAEAKGWPFYGKVVTASGVIVTARAQAGVFPKGTVLTAEDVEAAEVEAQMDVAAADVVTAVDINFWFDGAKIQPDTSKGLVDVTIDDPNAEVDEDTKAEVKTVRNGETETVKSEVNEDGVVAFAAEHFTVYVVSVNGTAVAEIETSDDTQITLTKSDDFAETIKQLQNANKTITKIELLGDVSLSDNVTVPVSIDIKKGMTLSGNNHSIYGTKSEGTVVNVIEGGITVTLDHVNIVGKAVDATAAQAKVGVNVNTDSTNVVLNIESCNVSNVTHYAINTNRGTNGTMSIRDSIVSAWGAMNIWGDAEWNITANSSTFTGYNDKNQNVWNNFSTICFEGDTTGATTNHVDSATIEFVDCTFTSTSKTTNKQYAFLFNAQSTSNKLIISGSKTTINCALTQFIKDNGTDNEYYIDLAANEKLTSFLADNGYERASNVSDNGFYKIVDRSDWAEQNLNYYWGDEVPHYVNIYSLFGSGSKGAYNVEYNEHVDLTKDITLTQNVKVLETHKLATGGAFYMKFGDYSITPNGYSFVIPVGVTMYTDKETSVFSAPVGYSVVSTVLSESKAHLGKTYLYTYAPVAQPENTVSFADEEGGNTISNQSVAYGGTATIPSASREGYTLVWLLSGEEYDFSTPVTENITLTAKWTPVEYTIGYTLNGGSATNPSNYNIESNITLTNPTRTGYTFTGWTGSNGETAQTAVTIATGSTGNKTYTANWTANNYTVTFNRNSGNDSSDTLSTMSVTYGEAYGTLASTSLGGYRFDGWYTAASGGTQVTATTTVTTASNHTLYAHWTYIDTSDSGSSGGGSASGGGTTNTGNTNSNTSGDNTVSIEDNATPLSNTDSVATNTETTKNDDGSTTTTTDYLDGSKSEVTSKTTENADGSKTTTTSGTLTDANGDKTEVTQETTTKTNSDGSTTATTTATETKSDGSTVKTESEKTTKTASDGTKTETETATATASDGSKTETKSETVTAADGSSTATSTEVATAANGKVTTTETETVTTAEGDVKETKDVTDATGSKGTTVTENGVTTSAEATITAAAVTEAKASNEAVTLPVTVAAAESASEAATVSVTLPEASTGTTKVEVPVTEVTTSTVAYVKNADGELELLKDCVVTENGVALDVEGNKVEIVIVDNAKDFSDVSADSWSSDAVQFVASREIFNGVGGDTFAPQTEMSRGMLAQVLFNFDRDSEATGEATFADASGKWYDDAANWASSLGVINGDNGQFKGDNSVTRQDLATMLYRYAQAKGYKTTGGTEIGAFGDAGRVSGYASEAMQWAVGNGLIGGTDKGLEPTKGATREEVAAIMMRFCSKIK